MNNNDFVHESVDGNEYSYEESTTIAAENEYPPNQGESPAEKRMRERRYYNAQKRLEMAETAGDAAAPDPVEEGSHDAAVDQQSRTDQWWDEQMKYSRMTPGDFGWG